MVFRCCFGGWFRYPFWFSLPFAKMRFRFVGFGLADWFSLRVAGFCWGFGYLLLVGVLFDLVCFLWLVVLPYGILVCLCLLVDLVWCGFFALGVGWWLMVLFLVLVPFCLLLRLVLILGV